ncbi:MAG: hypothetical protein N2489_09780, partial [Clostridia bacterium]|nr:hypothetical protein [Clostridia bacterium]
KPSLITTLQFQSLKTASVSEEQHPACNRLCNIGPERYAPVFLRQSEKILQSHFNNLFKQDIYRI